MQRADDPPTRHSPPASRHRRAAVFILAVVFAASAGYFGYAQYQLSRLTGSVRRSFETRHFAEAREPLQRWLRARPNSPEAQYYRAWMALIDDQGPEALDAIDRAGKLGIDPEKLRPLTAIYQARAGKIEESEPILVEEFDRKHEPMIEIAKQLARIYLSSYRFTQAATPLERWRTLDPQDPRPYLWSNEIASRSSGEASSVMIRNYTAALERDPNLDKARIGLAEQLSIARRFDEAEQEYLTYLKRNPDSAKALVGLGRNAFQNGDLEGATKYFEAALKVDPRQPEALKELAQTDLRFGRFEQASKRFETLTQIEPYDHEIRYSFAQALKLAGNTQRAQTENEVAARLRKDHDQLLPLRLNLLKNPNDVESQFMVAKWMLEHGHDEEGLKWTKVLLRTNPNHTPTHQILAEYYQKHGEPGLANYHRLMTSRANP